MTPDSLKKLSWSAVGILVFLAIWETRSGEGGALALPPPSEIFFAWIDNGGQIGLEIGATLRRAGISFLLAVVTMVPLGIICARVRWLGEPIEPVIQFVVAVPPPATIPIVMLFAGIGDEAKIAVIYYAAAPLILINTIEGVKNSPPMLELVGRSLRLRSIELMRLVDLPAALPAVFTGLRLAVGASLLVSITSEMLLATNGIGHFIQRSQESYNVAATLAGIATISIVGLIINSIVLKLEKHFLAWHYRND